MTLSLYKELPEDELIVSHVDVRIRCETCTVAKRERHDISVLLLPPAPSSTPPAAAQPPRDGAAAPARVVL